MGLRQQPLLMQITTVIWISSLAINSATPFSSATPPLQAPPPAYAAAENNPFGIKCWHSASPAFADADNDGDLDLFIGNRDGDIDFFLNTAQHP